MFSVILLIFQIIRLVICDSKNYYHLISKFSNLHIVTKVNSSLKIDNFIAITDSENHINFISLDEDSIKLTTPTKTSLVLSSNDGYTIGYANGSWNYKYISYVNITEKSVYYKIYTSSNDILYTAKFSNILKSNTIFPISPLFIGDSLYIMTSWEYDIINKFYIFIIAFQTYHSNKQELKSIIIADQDITYYTCEIKSNSIILLYYSKSAKFIKIKIIEYDEHNKINVYGDYEILELEFPEVMNDHKYLKMLEWYPYQYYWWCLYVENKAIYCVVFEIRHVVYIVDKYEWTTTAKYENIVIKVTEELNGESPLLKYNYIYISWFEGEEITFIQLKIDIPFFSKIIKGQLFYKEANIQSLNIWTYDADNALLLIEDCNQNIGFYSMTSYLFRNRTRYIDVKQTGIIDFSSSLVMQYNDDDANVLFLEFNKGLINLNIINDEHFDDVIIQKHYKHNIKLVYEALLKEYSVILFDIGNTHLSLIFDIDCRQAFPFLCNGCEMYESSITCTSCGNLILYEGICYRADEFDEKKKVKKRKICSQIKDNGHCEECAPGLFFNELTDEYDKEDCIFDCAVYNWIRDDNTKRCVKSCHPYEIINIDNSCLNCQLSYLFNYHGNCVKEDLLPENTYIKDKNYNYVDDCHPICRGCFEGSINAENPKCLNCTSNYTLIDSRCQCSDNYGEIITEENTSSYTCDNCKDHHYYNLNNRCFKEKPPSTFIVDETYNILGFCYDSCEECNEGGNDENNKCTKCKKEYFKNQSNCVKDCPWNMVNNNVKGICDDCSNDYKYVDPGTRQCKDEYPIGYYINMLNVITKCPINCNDSEDTIPPNLQKEICQNLKNKCIVQIILDGTDIEIDINPLPDISSKLEQFTQWPLQKKVQTLENWNTALVNASYNVQNIDIILYDIVELVRATKLSHEEKQWQKLNKESINNSIKSLSKIINSDDLRNKYLSEEPAIKVQTIALTSYYITDNMNYIEIDNWLQLSKTEDSVIQLISELACQQNKSLDSPIINHQDFIKIISVTTNTMISILNNTELIDSSFDETRFNKDEIYKYRTALINQDVTKTWLSVLESNSKLILDLSSTIKHLVKPFSNIKYITINLKDFAQESWPVDNEILVSNGDCDYSYTEWDAWKINEYSVQVCIDFKSILKQFDTAKYLGLVQYSHYPLLNPNITKGISKEFTAINIIDDNNHIIPAHHLISNVSLVWHRDKGFENCLFKNDSLLLSNSNCTSNIINDHYLKCTCNHWTDFTLTSLNWALIFKDIKLIFSQIRFIQSFDAFRLLTLSNAEALYIILLIVFIYVIVLIFAIKRDRKNNHHILFKVISEENEYNKLIDNMLITQDLDLFIDTIDDKIKKRSKEKNGETRNDNGNNNNSDMKTKGFESLNQEIVDNPEWTLLFGNIEDPEFIMLTNEIQLKTIKQDPKLPNSLGNDSLKQYTAFQWVRILFIIIIEFFKYQFWFSYLFLPNHNKNPKTIYVTLFFLKIFLKFAIAALLSTCNYKDELSDNLFNNRRLAVSLLTIVIVKLPVLFLGWLLSSKPFDKNKSKLRFSCLVVKYWWLFSWLIIWVIYWSANTIWITWDAFSKGGECEYKKDFVMALMWNLLLLKTSILLVSAFVFFIILRNYTKKQRINWWWIKMMACFPVLFTLKYQC